MVRPAQIISFPLSRSAHKTIDHWKKPFERKTQSPGTLSPNARRKLLTAIKWLTASATNKKVYEKKFKRMVDWKINLATFTFQENLEDDKLARQILGKWLEMAKYRFNIHSFIWKAEPQKRGAIHFHAIFNQYIPHKELKYTWNRLLRKNGLGNITNNSTDIHAVVNVNNLESYLAEYMCNDSKHEGRRKISGKLWACSHNLSQAGKKYLLLESDEQQALREDFRKYSLRNKLHAENKPIPEFLDFTELFILPSKFYETLPDCELKTLYTEEIAALQLPNNCRSLELFPAVN